ncbi:uncharacterized protein LOC121847512 [Oncorhynchus tshawytscha]|uniref:uncharacterized protein LOC121847512 n=1 Tax=Oncorhynchus tshawytscha TaxID=74940 RepID=UPI001C3D97F0|nr:uncharacterized protein LOC121847512 [Oncorhynchus tshawytscha]
MSRHLQSLPMQSPHKQTKTVTESPTNQGPSSVVSGSSDLRTHGHGRRFWTVKDPGHRLGNIAAPRQSWRQRKLSGGDMRRQRGSARGRPKTFWGGHTGSVAESGWRPEPTPRAYCKKRSTGQAPCYAVKRKVSPVRTHSPVGYRPAPRQCQVRVGIQPGCVVPAQRVWSPVHRFGPGYPALALRAVSPRCWEGAVHSMPALRPFRANVGIEPKGEV